MNKYLAIAGLVFLAWVGYSMTKPVEQGLTKTETSVSAYRARLEQGE